jgi:4-hydroxybenzoate polyprenyltransferase
VPLQYGILLSLLLFAAATLTLPALGRPLFVCAASYFLLTLVYSSLLKRRLLADVVALTLLYTLRIVAGAVAIDAQVSQWILCFSFFIFSALSMAKRIVELRRLDLEEAGGAMRRAYVTGDIAALLSLGGGSTCCAALTLALYVGETRAKALYHNPELLLLLCPLLFLWLSRLLLLAERGVLRYDPVRFVLSDRQSLLTLCLGFVIYAFAT